MVRYSGVGDCISLAGSLLDGTSRSDMGQIVHNFEFSELTTNFVVLQQKCNSESASSVSCGVVKHDRARWGLNPSFIGSLPHVCKDHSWVHCPKAKNEELRPTWVAGAQILRRSPVLGHIRK